MSAEGRREPRVAVTDAPDARVEAAIGEGLRRFNAQQSGIDDSRPLAVVVSDPDTNEVLGGITGRTSLGLLFIDLVFLPDELRGDGLGSRIWNLAEDEVRRRSCRAAMLDTISFQAPPSYEQHGRRVVGKATGDAP